MAEIRQMLSEVQQTEERRDRRGGGRAVPPAPDDGGYDEPDRHGAYDEYEADSEELAETESFLRDRVGLAGGQAGRMNSVRDKDGKSPKGDRKKLMGRHKRKRRKLEMQDQRGSGAGLTGFMFVFMVAGTLTGIYTFHPQLIEKQPEYAPALRQYVTAVDVMRVQVASGVTELRASIEAKIEEASKEDGEG